MGKIAHSIADLVGNTPIIQLNNINSNIYAKCEFMNPTSSVKDRIGMNMIIQAIKDGTVDKDSHIIEPTSGNTGVALASQCASLGIKLTLTMPESMSIERQKLMRLYGANLILVDGDMNDAINEAKKYALHNNVYMTNQFNNKMNGISHIQTTSAEILSLGIKFDYFVAGVGSGGTLMGVAKRLKPYGVKIIAVESKNSAPIYNKLYKKDLPIKKHSIQGIGAGFIPSNIDLDYIDDVILVDDDEVVDFTKRLPNIGITGGISTGANIIAAKN